MWSLGLSIVEIARGKRVSFFSLRSTLPCLTLIHFRYPYPPETYENVFAQLSAIVDGEAPGLPDDDHIPDEGLCGPLSVDVTENGDGKPLGRKWSPEARDWIRRCLIKNADERATYPELLVSIPCMSFPDDVYTDWLSQAHPWMKMDAEREVDMAGWATRAIDWRERGRRGLAIYE